MFGTLCRPALLHCCTACTVGCTLPGVMRACAPLVAGLRRHRTGTLGPSTAAAHGAGEPGGQWRRRLPVPATMHPVPEAGVMSPRPRLCRCSLASCQRSQHRHRDLEYLTLPYLTSPLPHGQRHFSPSLPPSSHRLALRVVDSLAVYLKPARPASIDITAGLQSPDPPLPAARRRHPLSPDPRASSPDSALAALEL